VTEQAPPNKGMEPTAQKTRRGSCPSRWVSRNMSRKPKCIVITGQPGSGKTTLAKKKLGERLWMPVISRDEIKEGYVNTYGVKHDQLPPDTNGLVSKFNIPTIQVSTDGEYIPCIDEIVKQIQSSDAQQGGAPDALAGAGDL
jgi:Cdc6-like AAA superfamily ATPase